MYISVINQLGFFFVSLDSFHIDGSIGFSSLVFCCCCCCHYLDRSLCCIVKRVSAFLLDKRIKIHMTSHSSTLLGFSALL